MTSAEVGAEAGANGRSKKDVAKWGVRALLCAVGLAAVVYLVNDAGPARVAAVVWQAGFWLPLILLLELVQLGADVVALRSILRERSASIPRATWIRSSCIAYAMMILVPAGRAAGEVARGAMFARHIGAGRATGAGTQLQAAYLVGNAILSLGAWGVVTSQIGVASPLAVLLAGNTLVMIAFAAALLAMLRNARLGVWVARVTQRFRRPAEGAAPAIDEPLPVPWRAMGACTVGRAAQTVQYGIILHAVGGAVSAVGAFVAHGIHLIGTTLGDLLPNQVGVVDGAYRAFAATLGFADEPARALSIAFVARIAQLVLAAACIVIAAVTRQAALRQREASSSLGADVRS